MTDQNKENPIRIAVVGTGLTGLVAAWSLSEPNIKAAMGNPNLEIHLFEKSSTFGVAAMSVEVQVPGSTQRVNVDIPYRATSDSFYPVLTSLINYLDVGRIFTNWNTTWSHRSGSQSDDNLQFISKSPDRVDGLKKTFNVQSSWWPSLMALLKLNWRNFLRTTRLLLQFLKLTIAVGWDWSNLKRGRLSHITFEEYLNQPWLGMDDEFIDMAMSLCATFCSCSVRAMRNYPASLILAFIGSEIGTHRTFLSRWVNTTKSNFGYRFKDGVITLAKKCAKWVPEDNMHFSSTVTNLSRVNNKLLVEYSTKGKKATTLEFDQVVLATEVQYAWPLLNNLPKLAVVRRALKSWKHEHSSIVMHTDDKGCMPQTGVWSSLNEVLCPELVDNKDETSGGGTEAFLTCWINSCDKNYAKIDVNIFQTWQPIPNKEEIFPYFKPDEEKVLIPPALVSRPIPTVDTEEHLAVLHKNNHQHGVHICGSYSQLVVPLLESCTTSALKAGREVFMSLENDSVSKEHFNDALRKLLDPELELLEWDDTATACNVEDGPIGLFEGLFLSSIFSFLTLLLTVSQLLTGTSSTGKPLNWEWSPFLAPLSILPLIIFGSLSQAGFVGQFTGIIGYITTAVLLWLFVNSLILSSLNRSKCSIFNKIDAFGLLLIAEVSSGLCFYCSVDHLAHQKDYSRNIFMNAYVSMTQYDHWIWSTRLLSISVVWAICLAIKPLQPSTGDQPGRSDLWRRMLRNTAGLGPVIFLSLGFVISVSAALAFFLCYLCVLSFEEQTRMIKRPAMYKQDRIWTIILALFIVIAGFGGVISLPYTEANRATYKAVVGLIHIAILSPGFWWASRDFEFTLVETGSYSTHLAPTIVFLSWATDLCAIRETLGVMNVWEANVDSCQLRVTLDVVFTVIAMVLWQRSMFQAAAVMIFPGASLAFNMLYDDINEKLNNGKDTMRNLNFK